MVLAVASPTQRAARTPRSRSGLSWSFRPGTASTALAWRSRVRVFMASCFASDAPGCKTDRRQHFAGTPICFRVPRQHRQPEEVMADDKEMDKMYDQAA